MCATCTRPTARAEFELRNSVPGTSIRQAPRNASATAMRSSSSASPALSRRSFPCAWLGGEDMAVLLRRMMGTGHGGTAAWHFLRDNWAMLIPGQPEKSIWRIMSGVSGLLRVEDDGAAPDAEDVRSFVAAHPMGGLHQLVEQSLELLDARLTFVRRQQARLGQVLGGS